jgi:ribonuclease-3
MDREGPPGKDAKTRLGEVANERGVPQPKYEVVARDGKSHQPEFTVRGHFDGISEVATARAAGGRRPRRRAEMLAAEKILRRLEELDKDEDVRKALRGLG